MPPEYYHHYITEKSWQILQDLARQFHFVLIGGWAVYLYTHALKSKDIDIVVSLEELSKLRQDFEVYKNERLAKYEIHVEGIDVDIYVEYYSNPGLPAEELQKYARNLEGYRVPEIEALLLLKQHAWRERRGSAKGAKDQIDMIALLMNGVSLEKYVTLLGRYGKEGWLEDLRKAVKSIRHIPELGLNEHHYARLKKQWLKGMKADQK